MSHNFIDLEKKDILTKLDYKRLEKLQIITNQYFRPLPSDYRSRFLKEGFDNSKTAFFITLILVVIHYFIPNDLIAMLLFLPIFVYLFILAHQIKKAKIEYIQKSKGNKLSEDFFIQQLKEYDLEIQSEEMDYYQIFLRRFIDYYLLKGTGVLAGQPSTYFEKDYVEELTIEELLVSAILFKNDLVETSSDDGD